MESENEPIETPEVHAFNVLRQIQSRLIVKKGLFNQHGQYPYRNAETILAHVKPLCEEFNVSIVLNDEPIHIDDRWYMQATAALYVPCGDQIHRLSAVSYAREPVDRKGMDAAQVSGASMSYARKYALCALLAIDSGADIDPDSSFDKTTGEYKPTKPVQQFNPLTDEMKQQISEAGTLNELKELCRSICDNEGCDEKEVNKFYQLRLKELKQSK